jgi:hypothetical protein
VSRLNPVSWQELVDRLKELGWDGPHKKVGRKAPHPFFMRKGSHKLGIPNPHRSDIGVGLLGKILDHAEISREEWLGDSH